MTIVIRIAEMIVVTVIGPGSFVHVDGGDSVILRIAGGEKLKLQKEKNNHAITPHAKWSLGKAIDVESAVIRSERLKKAS